MNSPNPIDPKIGDLVCYRSGFGAGPARLGRVRGFGTHSKGPVVDLEGDRWCYTDQITRIVESHDYLSRVEALIAEGCTRGDAQGIVEAQDAKAGRVQFVGGAS